MSADSDGVDRASGRADHGQGRHDEQAVVAFVVGHLLEYEVLDEVDAAFDEQFDMPS